MRDLVEEDGERGEEADGAAAEEAGPDGHAVGEVVEEVGEQVEVAADADVGAASRGFRGLLGFLEKNIVCD